MSLFNIVLSTLTYGGPVAIYFDVLRWRKKGVPVSPGRIAGVYTMLTVILPGLLVLAGMVFFSFVVPTVGTPPVLLSVLEEISAYVPVAGLAWYVFVYRPRFRMVSATPSPLPSVSTGSSLFFVFVLLLPFLAILAFVLFLSAVWR
jgi:hypothetical protein